MRDIIFGIYDKTYPCGLYMCFFKNEDDAKKELLIQMQRLVDEHGTKNLTYKDDRVFYGDDENDLVFIIHSFVLR